MLRFAIRDLLWFIALVGAAIAWKMEQSSAGLWRMRAEITARHIRAHNFGRTSWEPDGVRFMSAIDGEKFIPTNTNDAAESFRTPSSTTTIVSRPMTSMFRFTIRDLLWLMLVGVTGYGWLENARSLKARRNADFKK